MHSASSSISSSSPAAPRNGCSAALPGLPAWPSGLLLRFRALQLGGKKNWSPLPARRCPTQHSDMVSTSQCPPPSSSHSIFSTDVEHCAARCSTRISPNGSCRASNETRALDRVPVVLLRRVVAHHVRNQLSLRLKPVTVQLLFYPRRMITKNVKVNNKL